MDNNEVVKTVSSEAVGAPDAPASPPPIDVPQAVRDAEQRVTETFRMVTGAEVQAYLFEKMKQNFTRPLEFEAKLGLVVENVTRRCREFRLLGNDMRSAEIKEKKLGAPVAPELSDFGAIPDTSPSDPIDGQIKSMSPASRMITGEAVQSVLRLAGLTEELRDLREQGPPTESQEMPVPTPPKGDN